MAVDNVRVIFSDKEEELTFATDPYEALAGADALVLVTEWPLFRRPDFTRMAEVLKSLNVFDGRNLYDPLQMRKLGFNYFPIGRPSNYIHVIS